MILTEPKYLENTALSELYLHAFRERCRAICAELTRSSHQIDQELLALFRASRFLAWKCPHSSPSSAPSPVVFLSSAPERFPDYRLEDQTDHCRRELELFLTERKHVQQQMKQPTEF